MITPLIEARNLKKEFRQEGLLFRSNLPAVHALRNVSLQIKNGETLGLVGESGCGKSTLGRILLRLIEADSGEILFKGNDITHLEGTQLRKLRKSIQIIFQDPYGSLNPRMQVEALIAEPLQIHKLFDSKKERAERVRELLSLVGLPLDAVSRYPHEFSGGQRQRIGIARALAAEPEFIVCDEPVSALDVSVQGQILNLLMDLQDKLGLTYLFVAHDLRVVQHISNRVAVMYLGEVVEEGSTKDIFKNPSHPYTRALLSAIPSIQGFRKSGKKTHQILAGEVPSAANLPKGCSFATRCPQVMEKCHSLSPESKVIAPGHSANCFLL